MKDAKVIYGEEKLSVLRSTLPPIGVNTYFIRTNTQLVVIDPGYGTKGIIDEYFNSYLSSCDIIITHAHYDHIAGLQEFDTGQIHLSGPAQKALSNPELNLSSSFSKGLTFPENRFSTYTIDDGKYTIGGLSFYALLLPGHTCGDLFLDFGKFMFSGDILFENSIGRTDFKGSDALQMERSLRMLTTYLKKKNPGDRIFPGHLNFFTVGYALSNNPFLLHGE
jgi:glyoxylase-like metal-dependent hydrolase (beta-lactamase superfamily II)